MRVAAHHDRGRAGQGHAAADYVFQRVRRATVIPFWARTRWLFTRDDYEQNSAAFPVCIKDAINVWLGSPASLVSRGFYPYDTVGMAVAADNMLVLNCRSPRYHSTLSWVGRAGPARRAAGWGQPALPHLATDAQSWRQLPQSDTSSGARIFSDWSRRASDLRHG
jgi:hypothetical protein